MTGSEFSESLRASLDAARAALASGDAGGAAQRAKAIVALIEAARSVDDYTAELGGSEQDDEAFRADFYRRIRRLAEPQRGAERAAGLPGGAADENRP